MTIPLPVPYSNSSSKMYICMYITDNECPQKILLLFVSHILLSLKFTLSLLSYKHPFLECRRYKLNGIYLKIVNFEYYCNCIHFNRETFFIL